MNKPKLVIEKDRRWAYFLWFVLGFYELRNMHAIDLSVKTDLLCKLSFMISNEKLSRLIRRIYYRKNVDSYYFDGYLLHNGKKILFTIDCADTPYMFDYQRLKEKDIYFKMQYPNEIAEPVFHLTKDVTIPWIDSEDIEPKLRKKVKNTQRNVIEDFSEYVYKIKPLMVGPRELNVGNSYKALKEGYDNFTKSFSNSKSGKCMCYFGNSKGPRASETIINLDFGLEMICWGGMAKSYVIQMKKDIRLQQC